MISFKLNLVLKTVAAFVSQINPVKIEKIKQVLNHTNTSGQLLHGPWFCENFLGKRLRSLKDFQIIVASGILTARIRFNLLNAIVAQI